MEYTTAERLVEQLVEAINRNTDSNERQSDLLAAAILVTDKSYAFDRAVTAVITLRDKFAANQGARNGYTE